MYIPVYMCWQKHKRKNNEWFKQLKHLNILQQHLKVLPGIPLPHGPMEQKKIMSFNYFRSFWDSIPAIQSL